MQLVTNRSTQKVLPFFFCSHRQEQSTQKLPNYYINLQLHEHHHICDKEYKLIH